MRCSGGAGCLDCVTPFSSKMSFDIFIYLLLFFFFYADGPFSNHIATKQCSNVVCEYLAIFVSGFTRLNSA